MASGPPPVTFTVTDRVRSALNQLAREDKGEKWEEIAALEALTFDQLKRVSAALRESLIRRGQTPGWWCATAVARLLSLCGQTTPSCIGS
jgi:hypothetical protein